MSLSQQINNIMLSSLKSIAEKHSVLLTDVRVIISTNGLSLYYKAVPGLKPAYDTSLPSLIGHIKSMFAAGRLKKILNDQASSIHSDPRDVNLSVATRDGRTAIVQLFKDAEMKKTLLITDLID